MSSNGPFGKREDEAEYALMIGGVIVTDDDSQPVVFATKQEAYTYALRRFPMAMPDYLHRRVARDPWFSTTDYRDL